MTSVWRDSIPKTSVERPGDSRHLAIWSTFGFLSWPPVLRYCWLGCRMPDADQIGRSVLLGRDFLQFYRLVYDGPTGDVTLKVSN